VTALRITRGGVDDVLVQVDPVNALTLRFRQAGSFDADPEPMEMSFSLVDLESVVVVDPLVPVPVQGMPYHDGRPVLAEPEPEPEPEPARRRVAGSEPKLRKPRRAA